MNALGLVTFYTCSYQNYCTLEYLQYRSCHIRAVVLFSCRLALFSPWRSDKILSRISLYSVGALDSRNSLKTGWLTSLFRSSHLSICLLRASTCSLNVGSVTVNDWLVLRIIALKYLKDVLQIDVIQKSFIIIYTVLYIWYANDVTNFLSQNNPNLNTCISAWMDKCASRDF